MFFPAEGPADPLCASLCALRRSMNSPVVSLEGLPVGPAAAAIALHDTGGAEVALSIAVRAVRTGQVVFFTQDDELAELGSPSVALDAALSFAESMGFLFDDDEVASGGAKGGRAAARRWLEFIGGEPDDHLPLSLEEAEQQALEATGSPAAPPQALEASAAPEEPAQPARTPSRHSDPLAASASEPWTPAWLEGPQSVPPLPLAAFDRETAEPARAEQPLGPCDDLEELGEPIGPETRDAPREAAGAGPSAAAEDPVRGAPAPLVEILTPKPTEQADPVSPEPAGPATGPEFLLEVIAGTSVDRVVPPVEAPGLSRFRLRPFAGASSAISIGEAAPGVTPGDGSSDEKLPAPEVPAATDESPPLARLRARLLSRF